MPSVGINVTQPLAPNVPAQGNTGNPGPGDQLTNFGASEFNASNERFAGPTQGLFDAANQVGLDEGLARGRENVQRAFTSAGQTFERRRRALGIDDTARTRRGSKRKIGLARAVTEADTSGRIRRGFLNRSKAATAAASGLDDQLFSAEVGAFTQFTNQAAQRTLLEDTTAANAKAEVNAGLGGLVGMGAAFFSSEDLKHKKGEVKVLDRLKKTRIERWQYKWDKHNQDHIGPYAEEFNRVFETNVDNPGMIHVADAFGVIMGAQKELANKVEALESHGR